MALLPEDLEDFCTHCEQPVEVGSEDWVLDDEHRFFCSIDCREFYKETNNASS